ncbi:MAG: hypothetical protein ACP5XB_17525 [Isosphaeraceae bacterium]
MNRKHRVGSALSVMAVLVSLAGCGGTRTGDKTSASVEAIERKAEKGPVKLLVRITPAQPRLSDLVEMDVRVEAQPGVEIKPPAFGQAVGDFLIRDYSERPAEPGAIKVRRFHYQLEPAHAGKHLIRSVAIEFVDQRPGAEGRGEPTLVETEPLELNVTSELAGKAPSLADLEPMLPPQPVPRSVSIGWLIAAGCVALLAIPVVLWLRRRESKPVEARRRTPEEIAHEALELLLAENLPARGLCKEFYLRLTGVVRQYVEDTTDIHAPEQTTEEFLRAMRSRAVFPPDRSVQLAEFLEAADLIKYAGQQPGEGQVEQAIARAREFITLKPARAATTAASAE